MSGENSTHLRLKKKWAELQEKKREVQKTLASSSDLLTIQALKRDLRRVGSKIQATRREAMKHGVQL